MNPVNILVVEDEIIVAMDIQNRLRKFGYTVMGLADSGEEAIKKAANDSLDLVLMDIHLKGKMDGVEAAQIIHNIFKIPVIYLTANADESTLNRAKETEPFGYILKPFKEKELKFTIEITLSKHRTEKKLKQNEQWLTTVLKSIGDAVITSDASGNVTFMNPMAEGLTGWNYSDAFGKEATEIFNIAHEETRITIESPIKQVLQSGVNVGLPEKTILITKNGTEIPIDDSVAAIKDDNGNITGAVCVFQDITERQQILKALARRQQEFKALVENAPDIISRFNTQLRYVYVNPVIENVTGISAETFIGKTNTELNLPDEFCRICDRKLQQVFQTKQETEFECSLAIAQETKHYHIRLVPEFASDGSVYCVLSISRNITALKLAEAQLIYDAFHDILTGLPNRALFMERLERALMLSKRRANYTFAVLFLDLDRFKVVNDSLGHTIGDQLLTALARRLESCLRAGDTVARLGGDEFTILLEDLNNINDVTGVVERIHEALTSAFQLSGYEVFTTVSIGIALNKGNYNLPEELLRDADIAMYRAKALGKARHEIFDSSMYRQATEQLELEMDLRRAVERQEFQVYYQPIVLLETYKIIGFEALVRWQHPQQGLIPPDNFIPLAEETGLIIPIGYWVLREACRQMHAWQIQFPIDPPLTISVNLSTKQFSQPGLIEQICQIMQETGLEGSNLKLEITESVLMENIQSATFMLLQLQEMNIQIHLDDFGIGYSSLSYLHRFASNALKIDRSFVTKIGANGENLEIVQAIITLAQSLNIDVIAEGVETVEQLALLRAMKCKHAQGYFFSKPLDSKSIETLLASGIQPRQE
ncbi:MULTISPECIES: EAL domain-containing protein [unclassified Nostoc]|uniref:GGDEF domain-containing response regulator n=1 Tax=unclassified Nostoc TaxID=2593658 RepID=UPI002AD31CDE|nr:MULTISPECIES: EAL domain-containing protein [unclassified Nostoc]MDZ8124879.1 EAL domain-containing protein [Nostoc sp. CmiVER01]MDZ8223868.1 EAL domain-containing protein [Nostoc sp. ChiVER01]